MMWREEVEVAGGGYLYGNWGERQRVDLGVSGGDRVRAGGRDQSNAKNKKEKAGRRLQNKRVKLGGKSAGKQSTIGRRATATTLLGELGEWQDASNQRPAFLASRKAAGDAPHRASACRRSELIRP